MNLEIWDAVIIPKGYCKGLSESERFHHTFDLLEKLLGVNRRANERAWAKEMPDGERLFVTKCKKGTIYVPERQPGAGKQRYAWTDGENGIRYGRLIRYAD